MKKKIKTLYKKLLNSKKCVVLTGAGVSTDSGIPDFRSKECGLWNTIDPSIFTSKYFLSHPDKFYAMAFPLIQMIIKAEPNNVHHKLATLENRELISGIITQNIDGLHQKAGSKKVIEPHGNINQALCLDCKQVFNGNIVTKKIEEKQLPPQCDSCGGLLKLNVKLFGDPMSFDFAAATQFIEDCDLLLIIGTSLSVHPVSSLPEMVTRKHGELIVINKNETFLDEEAVLTIHEDLNEIVTLLDNELN